MGQEEDTDSREAAKPTTANQGPSQRGQTPASERSNLDRPRDREPQPPQRKAKNERNRRALRKEPLYVHVENKNCFAP